MTELVEILKRNAAIIEPKTGIEYKLSVAAKENRKLVVKLGFDPTAPDLHLGHAVVLQKMREFQDAGHRIVVIIGDFTARIGDPTGRNKTRPPLEPAQIIENAKTYVSHLSKVLDTSKIEVRYNSEWLDKFGMADLLKLMAKVTVAQIIQREDFKNRLADNTPIGMHELLYPLMQGSDSVAIDADIELGGTDQLFNNLMGRTLQEAHGKQGQVVMVMPLLVGLDGVEKMSKSKNNYIALTDEPENMYGKIMSIPDALIENYLTLGTTLPAAQVATLMATITNPMELKKRTAYEITQRFHGEAGAKAGQEHFERNVQNRDGAAKDYEPAAIASLNLSSPANLVDLCAALVPELSRSEIKRLVQSGGIRLNANKADDLGMNVDLVAGLKVQIGKRKLFDLT